MPSSRYRTYSTGGASTAQQVAFTPTGTIGSSQVQAAIEEVEQHAQAAAAAAQATANTANAAKVPTGSIFNFAAATPPTGFLEANGSAISRATYAALFAVVGTLYGVGNGTTTFNLPDLRGEFIRGWDHGRGVDAGRVMGSGQSSQNLSHKHDVLDEAGNVAAMVGFAASLPADGSGYPTGVNANDQIFGIGYSGGSEARPKNIALLACIKT